MAASQSNSDETYLISMNITAQVKDDGYSMYTTGLSQATFTCYEKRITYSHAGEEFSSHVPIYTKTMEADIKNLTLVVSRDNVIIKNNASLSFETGFESIRLNGKQILRYDDCKEGDNCKEDDNCNRNCDDEKSIKGDGSGERKKDGDADVNEENVCTESKNIPKSSFQHKNSANVSIHDTDDSVTDLENSTYSENSRSNATGNSMDSTNDDMKIESLAEREFQIKFDELKKILTEGVLNGTIRVNKQHDVTYFEKQKEMITSVTKLVLNRINTIPFQQGLKIASLVFTYMCNPSASLDESDIVSVDEHNTGFLNCSQSETSLSEGLFFSEKHMHKKLSKCFTKFFMEQLHKRTLEFNPETAITPYVEDYSSESEEDEEEECERKIGSDTECYDDSVFEKDQLFSKLELGTGSPAEIAFQKKIKDLKEILTKMVSGEW